MNAQVQSKLDLLYNPSWAKFQTYPIITFQNYVLKLEDYGYLIIIYSFCVFQARSF